MADWRTKGVVEDSEEEEDLISNESQSRVRTDSHKRQNALEAGYNTSTAIDGGAESNGPLNVRTPHEAHGEHWPKGHPEISQFATVYQSENCSSQVLPSPTALLQHGRLHIDQPQSHENSPSAPHPNLLGWSETSSPLSDAPSVLEDPAQPSPEHSARLNRQEISESGSESKTSLQVQQRHAGREELRQYIDVDHLDDHQVAVELSHRRNFRKRNPIQLHPYLLEGERYRNTMKARGVRPVQVVNYLGERELVRTENELDQDTDFVAEQSISSPLHQQESSPIPPVQEDPLGRLPEPIQETDDLQPSFGSDDGLPDVNDILDRKTSRSIQYGHKRRKLSHIPIPGNREHAQRVGTRVQTLPFSPPTSSQSPPYQPSKSGSYGFRIPKDVTSLPVATPAQSSDAAQGAIETAISMTSKSPLVTTSKGPPSSRRHRQMIVSSESSDVNSGSEDNDVVLQRLQKRIKGVLPASWLKLDQRSRVTGEPKTNAQNRRVPSLERDFESQLGVARKRTMTTRRHPSPQRPGSSAQAAWKISDDDTDKSAHSQATGSPLQRKTSNSSGSDLRPTFDDDSDPSDMEASWLDPMLPTVTGRQNSFTKRGRKRQTKLSDTFRCLESSGEISHATYHLTGRPGLGKPGRKEKRSEVPNRKPKRDNSPWLSIIDIPLSTNEFTSRPPQFLRVASRQVRKRSNRGRQSSRRKFIKLHTSRDTEEANEILRAWRAGIVVPNENDDPPASKHIRKPLQERLNNGQEDAILSKRSAAHVSLPTLRSLPEQQPLSFKQLCQVSGHNKSERQQIGTQQRPQHLLQHQALISQQSARTAQLETLEDEFDAAHPEIAFRRKLSKLSHSDKLLSAAKPVAPRQPLRASRRPRKRPPNRIDVETRLFRQPAEPLPIEDAITMNPDPAFDGEQPSLKGLGAYGTHYATSFDVFPLPSGTHFHQSTFVGSGDFSDAISFSHRDLDEPAVATTVVFEESQWTWSHWDSQLESQLGIIVYALSGKRDAGLPRSQSCLSPSSQSLKGIIRWCSRSLFFLDPIDRSPFISKSVHLLDSLRKSVVAFSLSCPQNQLFHADTSSFSVEILKQLVVLAGQIFQISKHPVINEKLKGSSKTFVIDSCKSLFHVLLSKGLDSLRDFQDRNQKYTIREAGIQRQDIAVECVLVLKHILAIAFPESSMFWELVNAYYMSLINISTDIRVFDKVWYDVFTLLPILELNKSGFVCVGARFQSTTEDWSPIKTLLTRVFFLAKDGGSSAGATFNAYIRATLSRCFNLVRSWGWRKCDPVLGVIFDFFAQSRLAPLKNEHSIGSPSFLEQLDQEPDLSLQPEDPSFHIFLKLLALGLQGLRSIYGERKLRSIVWRYIPNHGRTHHKENTLPQEHLDALRNHHDILCTLFWAAPPPCRPRLDLIRNLVDHSQSHREACRLNVRSWTILVRFLVSNDQPASTLEPFALWHRDIIQASFDQYRLAREEAEAQYQQASFNGEGDITSSILESTIASNQQQVLAIIRDALLSMISAVRGAKCIDAAKNLIQGSFVLELLGKPRQLFPVTSDCLAIVSAYIMRLTKDKTPVAQQASEESQEYGDWAGFEAVDIDEPAASEHLLAFLYDPMAQLISNAFGAEELPEDSILVKTVDVWVALADGLVQRGSKDWNSYLGTYGSWNRLMDTEQKRRYTPYFFARVLESCPSCISEYGSIIKTSWIEALVERESKLHHQHRLTAALLNIDKDDSLLHNLPFVIHADGTYDITLAAFRERRLSVIAILLSNIRKAFENPLYASDGFLHSRNDYIAFLKRIQATMRRNYEELQYSNSSKSSKSLSELSDTQVVKGVYITFVQSVVSLLQQYTTEIYPIDRFFTDSAAFPLPATDPTYVTGRLKSYSLRLHSPDSRTMKQLVTFVLSSSERAAVDGQQAYLVGQLRAAMEETYECRSQEPTLRRVLLLGVFSAFIDLAFENVVTAMLAKPILQASERAFQDLMAKFNVFNRPSVEATIELCTSFLYLLQGSVQRRLRRGRVFTDVQFLSTISVIYRTVATIVRLVDYLHRVTGAVLCAYNSVASFLSLGRWIQASFGETFHDDLPTLLDNAHADVSDSALEEVRAFCSSELGNALERRWVCNHEKVWWTYRGSTRQEVEAGFGLIEDERARLLQSIEDLLVSTWAVPSRGRVWSHLSSRMTAVFV